MKSKENNSFQIKNEIGVIKKTGLWYSSMIEFYLAFTRSWNWFPADRQQGEERRGEGMEGRRKKLKKEKSYSGPLWPHDFDNTHKTWESCGQIKSNNRGVMIDTKPYQ